MSDIYALIESVGCALVLTDETSHIVVVNERASLLFGMAAQQMRGRLFGELVQLLETEVSDRSAMAIRRGTGNRPCGARFPIRVSSRAWHSSDADEPHGTLHTLEDLSDQHAAQRHAWEMSQNFQEILANTPAVMYMKDSEWKYEYVNQRFLDLFHLTPETVIGKTDFDLFPSTAAQAFREYDTEVRDSAKAIQRDEVVPHDDGLHTYVSIKFPMFCEQGHVRAVAGISTDVTESRKAQFLEKEVQAAALVQNQLYPHVVPHFPGYEMAGISRPSQFASGDYYDLIPHGPGRLCVVVADVSGHGLAAALIMMETRAILRACLEDHLNLAVVTERLNRFLCHDTPEQQFVTFFLGEINATTQTLTYLAAGHPSSVIDARGQSFPLEIATMPLGLSESLQFHTAQRRFVPGEMLFVATDGIPEVYSPQDEMFGWNRTVQFVQDHRVHPAAEILSHLLIEVETFQCGHTAGRSNGSAHFPDDLTAVLVKNGGSLWPASR